MGTTHKDKCGECETVSQRVSQSARQSVSETEMHTHTHIHDGPSLNVNVPLPWSWLFSHSPLYELPSLH